MKTANPNNKYLLMDLEQLLTENPSSIQECYSLERELKRRYHPSYAKVVDKLKEVKNIRLKLNKEIEGVYKNAQTKIITYWAAGWILLGIILTILLPSCSGESKYGVKSDFFGTSYFEDSEVKYTINKKLQCTNCVIEIKKDHTFSNRIVSYLVIYEKNGDRFVNRFYLGKVFTEEESKNENYLRVKQNINN